jgi:hypothetical protein
MKTDGVVEVQLQHSRSRQWDEWSASLHGRFIPHGKKTSTHWIGCWVSHQSRSEWFGEHKNNLVLPGIEFRPSSLQAIAIPTELSRLLLLQFCNDSFFASSLKCNYPNYGNYRVFAIDWYSRAFDIKVPLTRWTMIWIFSVIEQRVWSRSCEMIDLSFTLCSFLHLLTKVTN